MGGPAPDVYDRDMTGSQDDTLLERSRRSGLRITGQRRVILEVLEGATDHPDVEELHRKVSAIEPGVNIATVYRTMNTLAERGLIERHVDLTGSDFARTLLRDWESTLAKVWQVCPKDMLDKLDHPINGESLSVEAAE